jgi:uncharacterized protein YqeY
MTIKEQIQKDFLVALKAKDERAKSALNSIKAKITESEKANNNIGLTDAETIKVLIKAVKQREESQKIYEDAGRTELASIECDEASVLRRYMPAQMSESEIKSAVEVILSTMNATAPRQALVGKTIGEFNKRFPGLADISVVKAIIESTLK